jgi:hypothetical protein
VGIRLRNAVVAACFVALIVTPSAHAAFPGATGKIAFATDTYVPGTGRTNPSIQTINPDGTGQATVPGLSGFPLDPAWSADGRAIAFSNGGNIEAVNPDGSNHHSISAGNAAFRPMWSPDDAQLVDSDEICTAEPPGCDELISRFGADGTNLTVIAHDAASPAWSPNGSRIAFVRFSTGALSTMSPDGSGQSALPGPILGRRPDWSPNGQKLAFSTSGDIYTVNLDGTGLTRLTTDPGDDFGAAWSPTGTKIAFTSTRNDPNPTGCTNCILHIYVMNDDGSNQTDVTSGSGDQNQNPSWQPIPYTGYPRPKGATPLRVPLVPAFAQCTSPNRTHGSPLAFPSCSPPAQASSSLTVGTPDANGAGANANGYVRFAVAPGDPSTPADEADVGLKVSLSDVRKKSDLSDYTGELAEQTVIRMTDKYNAVTGAIATDPATVEDVSIPIAVPCAASASTTIGSDCNLATTMDTVIPGWVPESKRSVWELGPVQVFDSGADGNPFSLADNTLFETQGVFVP